MGLSTRVGFASTVLLGVISALASGNEHSLRLDVTLHTSSIVEATPLLATLSLINEGESGILIPYALNEGASMAREAVLFLKDSNAAVVSMTYERGGAPPAPCGPARPPIFELPRGASLVADRVMCLIHRAKSAQHKYSWRILPEGQYTGYFELSINAEILRSNMFSLEVMAAHGAEAEIRELLEPKHLNFLDGRASASSYADFRRERSPRRGTDFDHFVVLENILAQYPDSAYSKWIEFWRLYYFGPIDEAVEYVRSHRNFALSDNLLLHMTETAWNAKNYGRARDLTRELIRDFPEDSDTLRAALELQKKLTKKR